MCSPSGRPNSASVRSRKSSASEWIAAVELVDGHGVGLPPGDQPLGERAVARQHLVEATVGRGQFVLGHHLGADAVAGLHLVGIADVLTGELAGHGVQALAWARSQARRWASSSPAPPSRSATSRRASSTRAGSGRAGSASTRRQVGGP